ncbi:MAG: hypothetical protein KC432_04070 [Thermomicrobiales bacterium]|nr:hypothetical protein [Thermomicrobiales bacterium]
MSPPENPPSSGGSGSSPSGSGPSGSDISALLAYMNHWSFGTDGDYTGNGGYGGENTGPVGSEPPRQPHPGPMTPPDTVRASPQRPLGQPTRRPGDGGFRRGLEPYTGFQPFDDELFSFAGQEIDPFSGTALGSDGLDPFTGTRRMDPFTAIPPARQTESAPAFVANRRDRVLLSPNLIAENGPIACDSRFTTCVPPMKSDFNQSSLANTIQVEMDESYNAILQHMEGKAQIASTPRVDVHEAASAAQRVTQSDDYKLAFQVNLLRDHPLEVQRSAVWAGLGHMAVGGVTTVGSALLIYGTGGLALPLIGAMGLSTGIAEMSSGAILIFSGANSTEVIRMSGQLDQAFALTSSPTSLVFGTTGLVLSDGNADVAYRFAVVGGLAENAATFRGNPSRLYGAIAPGGVATRGERGAALLLAKDVTTLGHNAHVESVGTAASRLGREVTGTRQSGLINPRAGEELFVGEWLNRNLQHSLDNTMTSFVADPRTMATLVPSNIPYKAIPQYGGYVIEYGTKATVEGNWALNSIVQGVPQSSQMVRGGAPDLVLRPQFAGWNLKGWDITTFRAAATKADRGVDYTFVTYTVDWGALGL